jgi:hypothetical protein
MNVRRPVTVLALLSALVPAVAWAQGSDADKATARELTRDGYAALDRRDYAAAADLFVRADALHHAPTVSVGLARARVALGKLVSAQELYSLVTHEALPPGSAAAFVQAHEEAERELAALTPRVPAVILQIEGPAAPQVSLDGADVPAVALGVKRPVDPGKHVVKVAARGFYPAETTFTSAEGAVETVTLELKRDGTSEGVPGPPPLVAGPTRRVMGLVGLGLGGVGIVVGAVAGGLAVAKHADLAKACSGGNCVLGTPSSAGLPGEVSAYRTDGIVSTAGFIAGGALAVTGAVLFATAPRFATAPSAVAPVVGPGYAGVQGRF